MIDNSHARGWSHTRAAWREAVELAIEDGQFYGLKCRVFRDPRWGWTWELL